MGRLNLILRWAHVFAGILWVGATYYFTWLDGRFVELEKKASQNPSDKNPEKLVWMVHSGGFYLVEKEKNPRLLPLTGNVMSFFVRNTARSMVLISSIISTKTGSRWPASGSDMACKTEGETSLGPGPSRRRGGGLKTAGICISDKINKTISGDNEFGDGGRESFKGERKRAGKGGQIYRARTSSFFAGTIQAEIRNPDSG